MLVFSKFVTNFSFQVASDPSKTVEKKNGEFIVASRNAHLTIQDEDENLLEKYSVPYGAEILYSDKSKVEPGTLISKWDPLTPSLGTLIRLGNDFLFSGEWWITFFPAIFLVILAFSINLLGD